MGQGLFRASHPSGLTWQEQGGLSHFTGSAWQTATQTSQTLVPGMGVVNAAISGLGKGKIWPLHSREDMLWYMELRVFGGLLFFSF